MSALWTSPRVCRQSSPCCSVSRCCRDSHLDCYAAACPGCSFWVSCKHSHCFSHFSARSRGPGDQSSHWPPSGCPRCRCCSCHCTWNTMGSHDIMIPLTTDLMARLLLRLTLSRQVTAWSGLTGECCLLRDSLLSVHWASRSWGRISLDWKTDENMRHELLPGHCRGSCQSTSCLCHCHCLTQHRGLSSEW